jgi:hypothetical protein
VVTAVVTKLVLFDLGDTLETGGVLLPGARETLQAIATSGTGETAPVLCLVSDFLMPAEPEDVAGIRQQYYELLDGLGLRGFFEPVAERVTLSTEVGAFKPDPAMFRAAADKIDPGLDFGDILFITENPRHVLAARLLGLSAVHVRGPGQSAGDVESLPGLIPLVREFLHHPGPPVTTIVRDPHARRSDAVDRLSAGGARWTRLGDTVLVQSAGRAAGRSGADRPLLPEQRLHLVTQLGRSFQEDHPGVRVVVDKGRYLVVDPAPGQLTAGNPAAGCYDIRPLPADTAVFAERPPGTVTGTAEGAALPGLSRASYEHDVDRLASLRTRHSGSAEFLDALAWAKEQLADLGFATMVQDVPFPGGRTRNLVAERPGSGSGRQVALVTGHLDSVNLAPNNAGGAPAPAPGADDNASGSAGVLAVGRALAGRTGCHGLRLVLFGGEEQGLFGSRHYVDRLDAAERARILAVVNMDMIACRNTEHPTVLLEGAPVSEPIVEALAGVARQHTTLAVQTSLEPFNSDHVPFLHHGIPAVLTIEGTDSANHRLHTAQDTVETLDVGLAMEILLMNTLFIAQTVELDASITPAGQRRTNHV